MPKPIFTSCLSTQADSDAAVRETVRGVLAGLGDRAPDLLAVFVSHHHGTAIETLGPRLAEATRARTVIGCTGEGIVGSRREIESGAALSIFAGVLPGTQVITDRKSVV